MISQKNAVTRHLQSEMMLKGVSFQELASHFHMETPALRRMINRGQFKASFYIQALHYMSVKSVDVAMVASMEVSNDHTKQ